MEILASLESFLKAQPETHQQCPKCLSEVKHLHGMFWIPGTENKWEVSLPFCQTCEPELLQHSPDLIH